MYILDALFLLCQHWTYCTSLPHCLQWRNVNKLPDCAKNQQLGYFSLAVDGALKFCFGALLSTFESIASIGLHINDKNCATSCVRWIT